MAKETKQLTIRLTAEEAAAIQGAAERDYRSLNDQVRWLLAQALKTECRQTSAVAPAHPEAPV